ncbi:MAG: hypothetical protein V5A44_09110 [Haloarculaceae archaeon]
MCYESLVDGEATDRPLATLLRGELRDAFANGLGAAALVVAVLVTSGVDPAVTAAAATGALALGTVFHQTVLVVATGVLRVREGVGFRSVVPDRSGRDA